MQLLTLEQQKQELRRKMLNVRRSLPEAVALYESKIIVQNLFNWKLFQEAETIFCYLAMPGEVQTFEMVEQLLRLGKKVCVPVVLNRRGSMKAAWLHSTAELIRGAYSILELPTEQAQWAEPAAIDINIVPGMAFSRSGQRLGMGGGYYDRFLNRTVNAASAGLTFGCQLTASIPCEEYDQKMQYIAMKEGILECASGRYVNT